MTWNGRRNDVRNWISNWTGCQMLLQVVWINRNLTTYKGLVRYHRTRLNCSTNSGVLCNDDSVNRKLMKVWSKWIQKNESQLILIIQSSKSRNIFTYFKFCDLMPFASKAFSSCRTFNLAMSNSWRTFHRWVSHIGSVHRWFFIISCASYTAPLNVNDFPKML